jgi:hypothetical protein
MALLVPNEGETLALAAFLNKTAQNENPELRLYSSNTTPAETDTDATYTEATFAGYAAATLTGSSWSVSAGAPSSATYAQQTFTRSSTGSTENIYGYYVVQTTTLGLMWAERFSDGPYAITNNGDNIKITPALTAD